MRILQISKADVAGGAEACAYQLLEKYKELGQKSWLIVGEKNGASNAVLRLPNDSVRSLWFRMINAILTRHSARIGRVRGLGRSLRLLRDLGQIRRKVYVVMGHEDFDFPGTRAIISMLPAPPDVVHLHNLHGGYFDLRQLPDISRAYPTILNLHDAWLFSGHCAFSLGCDRWRNGCGKCPDLTLYPSIPRDATAANWLRKREIFRNSRLYVTAPSKWLLELAKESILAPAICDSRVIPNGVDTNLFSPGDRVASRQLLGFPGDAQILLTAANGLRSNPWKDFKMLRLALSNLVPAPHQRVILLAIGDVGEDERIGCVDIKFVPYVNDREILATYYRAADVYVHTAVVESFGTTLLEARACGIPVIATAVGGIPEHVAGFDANSTASSGIDGTQVSGDGVLVSSGDAAGLVAAINLLLTCPALAGRLGDNGRQRMLEKYSLDRQCQEYLNWYVEVTKDWAGAAFEKQS